MNLKLEIYPKEPILLMGPIKIVFLSTCTFLPIINFFFDSSDLLWSIMIVIVTSLAKRLTKYFGKIIWNRSFILIKLYKVLYKSKIILREKVFQLAVNYLFTLFNIKHSKYTIFALILIKEIEFYDLSCRVTFIKYLLTKKSDLQFSSFLK